MRCSPFYKILSSHFRVLGCYIARQPSWFIILPVFSSIILGTGLQRRFDVNDIESLMTPKDSKSQCYRKTIDSLFPMNISTNFDLGRITRLGRYGNVIILAKDGQSVLRKHIFNEIIKLDQLIHNISIQWEGRTWNYRKLCAKTDGRCYSNDVLDLANRIEDIEIGLHTIKYPMDINLYTNHISFYANSLGGVKINANNSITATAIRLAYFLDNSAEKKEKMSFLWEKEFENVLGEQIFEYITLERVVSASLEREASSAPRRTLFHMIVACLLVTTFTMVTCSIPNWIQGKPWIALVTAVSSGLATVSGFGLMAYCGIPYVFFNTTVPFLVLGIGMDDTFVLLSTWRRTDPKDSVESRLGNAYSESAVSITLTSVTNIICFFIGTITTSFIGISIYCGYICCCLFFDYIYQITFVGGWMAVFGYAENKNLHCLTFLPVKDKNSSNGKEDCTKKLLKYTGHYSITTNNNSSILLNIWNKISNFLHHGSVKIGTIIILFIYLSIGLLGGVNLKSELKFVDLTFYNTHLWRFVSIMQDNFNQYQERIQVVITKPLNYADLEVQVRIENMTQTFESHPLMSDSSLTESWLRSFLAFIKNKRTASLIENYNISDNMDFIELLRNFFFRHPLNKRFQKDVVFNKNYTKIIASRFLLQSNLTRSEFLLYKLLRYQPSFPSLDVIVYNPLLYAADGTAKTVPSTFQIFAITALASVVITFTFLPNITCAVCVSCSIVSIAIGVIGYMTWWQVNVNLISMVTLIAISGFSVDYVSHITYAYISSDMKSPTDRMANAVKLVGFPILQGSLTTILCILPFAFPPSEFASVAMKIIILLCIFSAIHAVFFLPIMLCVLQMFYLYIKKFISSEKKLISFINHIRLQGTWNNFAITHSLDNISNSNEKYTKNISELPDS